MQYKIKVKKMTLVFLVKILLRKKYFLLNVIWFAIVCLNSNQTEVQHMLNLYLIFSSNKLQPPKKYSYQHK